MCTPFACLLAAQPKAQQPILLVARHACGTCILSMTQTGGLMSESNLAVIGFKVLRIHIPSNSKRNGLSLRNRKERSRMVAGGVTLSSLAVTGNGSSKRLTKKWFRMNPQDPSTMFHWLHGLAYSTTCGNKE